MGDSKLPVTSSAAHPQRSEDAHTKEADDYFIVEMTNSVPSLTPAAHPQRSEDAHTKEANDYFIVGMTNSAPSLTPDGQREVTVLVLV